ncbi:hypothetical protein Scep_011756 [Stephania cephalantha]|uniref:DUF641 domain-containing protein n=1 Tax=Stephania cephalantha TaxID=152367 RepID=A0AAP0JFR7_9MAGN
MDSVKRSSSNSLVRRLAKALTFRASGVAPEDRIRKIKYQDKKKLRGNSIGRNQNGFRFVEEEEERREAEEKRKAEEAVAVEALFSGIFAGVSSIKAAYAQLQIAQSPYDPDEIQSADEAVVAELKKLSELKSRFLKKESDPNPQMSILLGEIQEQRSLLRTYELMGKKIEVQIKNRDSEIDVLKEKLEELENHNSLIEQRFDSNVENVHISGLNPTHFASFLQHTIKSIRAFVEVLINEMKKSKWDLEIASQSINPTAVFRRPHHRLFVFQSFVSQKMFDGFQHPKFSISHSNGSDQNLPKQHFYDIFVKMKSMNPKQLILQSPTSSFSRFCIAKYTDLVHPNMELSFSGDLKQRNSVLSNGYPETQFFSTFAEMAKRVWMLNCLAFSFGPKVSIFQVSRGCRFSQVFMESVIEETEEESTMGKRVGLLVTPGFRIDKTVLQCQVYLS